jgi:hypothetical protein
MKCRRRLIRFLIRKGYGADYLIEFECREVDGAESCITEQEAKDFAERLFVAQTR